MSEIAATTTKELFGEALDAMVADPAALLERCTDDVILEFPFAPAGQRILKGRDEAKKFLETALSQVKIESVVSREIHETRDPDVVIAELTMNVSPGGSPARPVVYVLVVTIHDGLVTHWREYIGPMAVAS